MEENNYDYLNKQLLNSGFGESHKDELKEKMKSGQTEFSIAHQQNYGKDETVATLQFKKGNTSELYFFNRFLLVLKNDQLADPIKQSFPQYHMQDNNTLKEAYNLLSGRSVYREFTQKEGEKYKAWETLDFKATDKYGNFESKRHHRFDLEKELGKLDLKEGLDPERKQQVIQSLQRGNLQTATLLAPDSTERKIFIEAAPREKTLRVFDESMVRISIADLSERVAVQQTKQEEKKVAEPKEEQEEKKTKRQKIS